MSNRYSSLALLVCIAAVAACDKNGRLEITEPASGAAVKFFNFGVNVPGVIFYANSQKITAIASGLCQPPNDTTTVCRTTGNDSSVGTAYGAAGAGGLYSQVIPGQYTLSGNFALSSANHFAISALSTTLETGKFYSYFISGIYDAGTKKADAFIVEDPIPTISDFSMAYVRFVNAVSNSAPMTLYAKSSVTSTETAIGSTVAYKAAGAFVAVPGAVYDLSTRAAGSSTNIVTRTAVSFVAGHVYTVTARGDMLSTVTATKPALDNTANR